ncbi:uncharacterized protein METZ01_LOCUS115954, partial [marine metagenome]
MGKPFYILLLLSFVSAQDWANLSKYREDNAKLAL